MQFLGCNLINSKDRPYKVYISLKLGAFYIHFKKENVYFMGSILSRYQSRAMKVAKRLIHSYF